MNSIIRNINKYKARSEIPIHDQQIAYIPTIDDSQIEYTIPYYILEGKRVPVNIVNQLFIKVKYLKFGRLYDRNLTRYRTGEFKLKDLVDGKIVNPFLLFINGHFIPWEYISIILNHDIYHIIVDGSRDIFFRNLCRTYDYIQIVNLPDSTTVTSNYNGNPYDTLFVFNSKGEYDTDNIKYAVVQNSDKIGFNYWHTNNPVKGFILLNQNDIKITKDNVFLFVNGLFCTGNRFKVKKAMEKEKLNEKGEYEKSYLNFAYSEKDIGSNPDISIISTILTINNGINDKNDIYDFGVFVNPDYSQSVDNVSKIRLKWLSSQIVNNYNHVDRNKLAIPFSMKMDRKKKYSDNVLDCITTMMSYNASFLNDTIKDNSNISIVEYTGKWLLDNMRYNKTIHIPINHESNDDELFILLVNGELYRYYNSSYKIINRLIIPIKDINDKDVIEFIRIKNINNREIDTVINHNDGYLDYDDTIINDSMMIFSSVYNNASYQYPEDGDQNFEIGYTLSKSNGKTKIVLDDPFYYGKPLTIVSKNRAKYYGISVPDSSENGFVDFNLGKAFKYCSDYNKFVVFVNGRRITSDHYRLVIPTKPTTPFHEYRIYLTTPILPGGRLDVFYIPNYMQDIVVKPNINSGGIITLDKSILDYGFNTELYMIWINGKKIPLSHMRDINSNKIIITFDEKSTNELCIMKYIPTIDILDNIFSSNDNVWDSITRDVHAVYLKDMLDIRSQQITDTEKNLYNDSTTIKSIMHELIRDQFATNPKVDVTDAFIYDYTDIDTSVAEDGKDSGNNITIMSMDANTNESIDAERKQE